MQAVWSFEMMCTAHPVTVSCPRRCGIEQHYWENLRSCEDKVADDLLAAWYAAFIWLLYCAVCKNRELAWQFFWLLLYRASIISSMCTLVINPRWKTCKENILMWYLLLSCIRVLWFQIYSLFMLKEEIFTVGSGIVEPHYNDISLYDTSSIVSDILCYLWIPHCYP